MHWLCECRGRWGNLPLYFFGLDLYALKSYARSWNIGRCWIKILFFNVLIWTLKYWDWSLECPTFIKLRLHAIQIGTLLVDFVFVGHLCCLRMNFFDRIMKSIQGKWRSLEKNSWKKLTGLTARKSIRNYQEKLMLERRSKNTEICVGVAKPIREIMMESLFLIIILVSRIWPSS